MPKHFIVGFIILSLAFLAPLAAAQGGGAIEAQVLNGTESDAPIPDLTVTLRSFRGMGDELEPQTAVTDAGGRVRFADLDTSPDVIYILSAAYADLEYNSQQLNFAEDETILTVSLQVYESTENPDEANIQVERMHVFVDFAGGVMSVGEMYIFSSAGNRTFIGTVDPESGRRFTMRFALPEGAANLRFQMGGGGERFVVTESGFADTEPLRPGLTQQLLYGYDLRYDEADTLDFSRLLRYPTANLNVLVPRVGVDVTSDQVELSEISTVEGQAYLNLNGQDFAPGDKLTVHFSGLQNIASQPAATNAVSTGLNPKWIAFGLAALALFGGLIYYSQQGSERAIEAADAPLDRLLRAIADLDDDFEAGRIAETDYRRQRQSLKSKALALMQES